jgi:hypothetical protein
MSSLRRIQASRANGAKSRGPVTADGKARSSKNALKHGLLSSDVVLASESKETFKQLLDALIARWQPADQAEMICVEHMAAAEWRIRRIWTTETRDIDDGMDAWRKSLPNPADQLKATMGSHAEMLLLFGRYETRLHSMFNRAFAHLKYLQSHRAPNEPDPDIEHDQDNVLDHDSEQTEAPHNHRASTPATAAMRPARASHPLLAGNAASAPICPPAAQAATLSKRGTPTEPYCCSMKQNAASSVGHL